MVLTAVRGALGFLSRVPIGHGEASWEAFRRTPAALPVAGFILGVLIAIPFAVTLFVPASPPTLALALLAAVFAVTGITHVDGVADLGDAAVVHGDPAERRAVLKDTTVGTGGVVAVAVVVAGLLTAGLALASLPVRVAVAVVIAAEVGAKTSIALLVCFGEAPHEGLGSALTTQAGPREAVVAASVAAPAALIGWPQVGIGVAVLAAAVVVAALVLRWAQAVVGGVNGDVLGATNELARVAALHVGLIAWTLS